MFFCPLLTNLKLVVRVSLRAPQLIPGDPEVIDRVNPPMALLGLKVMTIGE